MPRSLVAITCSCIICFVSISIAFAETTSHDKQFWRDIARNGYKVPADASSAELAHELSGFLGSPDPELRDELAYSILAVWIARGVLSNADMLLLANEWRSNLRNYNGDASDQGILRSSFSALCLSEIAGRDAKTHFMEAQDFRGLLDGSLTYLNKIQGVHGYDPQLGWIHATAHTADLLRGLAMNPLFTKQDQSRVLSAISGKLSSTGEVYTHGEQDRLAMAVVTIIRRSDFDDAAFRTWLEEIRATNRSFWRNTPHPSAQEMAQYQNRAYMIEALAARLSAGAPLPGSNSTDDAKTPWSSAAATALQEVFSLLSEQ
jgi:hypothetical protein